MTDLIQAELFLGQRDLSSAARHFLLAQQQFLFPDRVDAGFWQLHMLAGDFEQAWQASDRIRERNSHDLQRFWTGEPIAGKDVVVRSLHGLGDAVQMFQYATKLKSLARSVIWQVPPKIVKLATRFQDVDRAITWEQPCTWNVQVEITELPYLFRTTIAQLPIATRYLNLPYQPVLKPRPRVGLVWAAGEWNRSRSIPFSMLESILNNSTCDFVSLQGGPNPESHPRLETIKPGLLSLATSIAKLDLVLTVDTLAAHLAGALNVPAYLLLEHAADWRWMTARNDTPWYPSLRLFRQPSPGDWSTPLKAINGALDTLSS